MKILAAILLLCVSTAQAGFIYDDGCEHPELISQTKSFGIQGSSYPTSFGLGTLNHTITLDPFDFSLGRLTKIFVTMKGQINSKGYTINKSEDKAHSAVSIQLTEDWAVNGRTFATGELFADSTNGHTLGTGERFNYNYSSGEYSSFARFDPERDFQTSKSFTFTAKLATYFANTAESGITMFENHSIAATWGEVRADFFYIPKRTPVPEPTTWLMLAGVAFLLLRVASNKHI